MADRIITVTNPSVVTNDTLSGYNNYSDIDGQLGTTMTPTEATNGKTVALSDGVVHEVTSKPVGTSNGEFSSVVSNAVTVDLSSQTRYKVVTSDVNRIDAQSAEQENLSPSVSWSITYWVKGLPSSSNRSMGVGLNLTTIDRKFDGSILFQITAPSSLCQWTDAGVLATDDTTTIHKYKFSWTPAAASVQLSIDDVDYGDADVAPATITGDISIASIGRDSAANFPWEFTRYEILNDGVLHTWDNLAANFVGATWVSDTGKVMDLTTTAMIVEI